MLPLKLDLPTDRPVRLLCLGAHSDDIEIGCGGTILRLLDQLPRVDVRWVVLSGSGERAAEARAASELFLAKAHTREVRIHDFRDGFFPHQGAQIKEVFETLKDGPDPDLILSHHHADLHQDHRVVSELTWNTYRDNLVLEYEVPKYDGGLSTPSLFVGIDEKTRERKIQYLMEAFATQRGKRWFSPETFLGLMRLRGVESAVSEGYAEGFHARKTVLSTAP